MYIILKSSAHFYFLSHIFFHLFTFEVPFKSLFVPTSQGRMSKKIKDQESLGKSNGKKWSQMLSLMSKNFIYSESLGKSSEKKWSQISTFLLKNGLKLSRQKSFFLQIFFSICSLLGYRSNVFDMQVFWRNKGFTIMNKIKDKEKLNNHPEGLVNSKCYFFNGFLHSAMSTFPLPPPSSQSL